MRTKTDFASHNLTVGQINAIVKRLGGEEMALRFLRGELTVHPALSPPEPLPTTLAEFMASDLGANVMERLKAAGTYILIAESEPMMSQTASVSFDGEGFVVSVQIVGMAAVYAKEKPSLRRLMVEEALENIRECGGEEYGLSEAELVERIVDEALRIPDMT